MTTPNSDAEQTYLTASQAAERMGITVETVRQLCIQQRLKGAYQEHDNGPWRIPTQSVETWLQQQNQTTFDQSEQQTNQQTNIAGDLNTDGGFANTGQVHAETGDVTGRDKTIQGDEVHGDKVEGDKVAGDKHIHEGGEGVKPPNSLLGRFLLSAVILAIIITGAVSLYSFSTQMGPTPTPTSTPLPTPTPLPFTPATDDEFLILITNFYLAKGIEDAEPHREIWRAIREQAKEMGMDNLRVEIDPNITLRAEVQEEAQVLGERYNASLVIWGDETNVRMQVHFLNLKEPDFDASNVKIDETEPFYSKGEPYSRFITEDLPGMLTFLSLFAIGQIQYSEENYEDAIQTIKTAISSTDSKDINGLDAAYFRLGWLYQVPFNDIKSALSYYNKAVLLNPDNAAIYNNRGVAYRSQEEYEKAIEDYNQALFLNPDDAIAYNNLGTVNYAQGDYEQAITNYNQAISLNPNYAEPYHNRGLVYSKQWEYEKAIADYTQAIFLEPDLAEPYRGRGTDYYDQGEYEKAIADFDQAISLNPDYAIAYNSRGLAYKSQREYKKAIADFDQAISLNPDDDIAYNNRGNAYYEQEEYEKAIKDYTQAISLDLVDAITYYNRGITYDNQGNYEKAIADYTQAISLNSDYSFAYYHRGRVYTKQGDYEQAIADYTQTISLNPSFAPAYNSLCWLYVLEQQPEKALPFCQQSIEIEPNNPNIRDSRGLTYALLGDFDKAILDFQYFVNQLEGSSDEEQRLLIEHRRGWIEMLKAGENPFTPELLEELRIE